MKQKTTVGNPFCLSLCALIYYMLIAFSWSLGTIARRVLLVANMPVQC